RSHLAGCQRIHRTTGDARTAKWIPGKVDRGQPDGCDVVGQRFVVDAGDDPLALPALRNTKALVAAPRLDMDQPVPRLLGVATDALDEPNSPRSRGINQ